MQPLKPLDAEGRTWQGRAPKMTPVQAEQAYAMIESGTPIAQVARFFKVTRQTVYRSIERERGTFAGVRGDVAAMKLELTELRQWRDMMLASAPSGEQATS